MENNEKIAGLPPDSMIAIAGGEKLAVIPPSNEDTVSLLLSECPAPPPSGSDTRCSEEIDVLGVDVVSNNGGAHADVQPLVA